MTNKHSVYIPQELWEKLEHFCEKEQGDYKISTSAVICRAIKELIEKE